MRSIVTALLVVLAVPLAPACASEPVAAAPPEGSVTVAPPPPPPQPQPRVKVIASIGGVVNTGWAADWAGFAGTSRGCMRSYSMGRFAVTLPLEEGDRMLSLTLSAIGNSSADLDVTSFSAAPTGDLALGSVGSLDAPNVLGGNPTDFTIDLVDTLVAGGVSYWFEISADQAGICVGALRLTYDRPNG